MLLTRLRKEVFCIGERCVVMSGVLLATYGGRISVGDDVSFNPGVIIYGHGGVTIGSKTRIAAGSLIVSANHNFANPEIPIMNQGLTCKGIEIGTDVWIGAHVMIRRRSNNWKWLRNRRWFRSDSIHSVIICCCWSSRKGYQ